jgi:hypothetical protein
MEQKQIVSGLDLIKRLNIPAFCLLDDPRYHGKFCPRNKKTGTPIPPPGREHQFEAIETLKKMVSEGSLDLYMMAGNVVKSSNVLPFIQMIFRIGDDAYADREVFRFSYEFVNALQAEYMDLDLFRSKLDLLADLIGYPDRMWERYYPADEDEKSRAIDILLGAVFWVPLEAAAPLKGKNLGNSRAPTGERGMARLLFPFGLQWIRGCEAIDTIPNFTSYRLYELVREGLTPHSEDLQPLLPTRVSLMYVERAMWEEWLNAEDEYHRNTLLTRRPYLFYQVKQLAKSCDYELSDDSPPILVPRHSFTITIPGIPEQPIKEKTREEYRNDAKKNIAYLTEQIAGYGPNPWATIVFDLNEEEVESLALLGAHYKHSDLMARLRAPEPVTATNLSPTMAGSLSALAAREPKAEPPGRRYTALTNKAKGRLIQISPAIIEFDERLKALVQDECETLANADADDWETQALSLLEDGGKWNEIIIEDDIKKISFATLAKSEHKERLKTELAQIVLEREGYGRINRKTLHDFVK